MGGSKGGFIPPFASAKVIETAVFVYRLLCLLSLGELHRLHDGDFGKNTILEKHEIHDRRASNFKFFREIAKVGKSFAEIKSYKQTPVLSL